MPGGRLGGHNLDQPTTVDLSDVRCREESVGPASGFGGCLPIVEADGHRCLTEPDGPEHGATQSAPRIVLVGQHPQPGAIEALVAVRLQVGRWLAYRVGYQGAQLGASEGETMLWSGGHDFNDPSGRRAGCLGLTLTALAVAALEALHPAGSIHDLHRAGEEWVASRRDFHLD